MGECNRWCTDVTRELCAAVPPPPLYPGLKEMECLGQKHEMSSGIAAGGSTKLKRCLYLQDGGHAV